MPSHHRHPRPGVPADPDVRSAEICLFPGTTGTAWRAILGQALGHYDRVLVLGGDAAARHWADIASDAGLRVEMLETPTPKTIARRIGADRFGLLKAVLVVADAAAPREVRAALDAALHDALLFVDASAGPCPDLTGAHADIVLTDPRAGLARLAAR